ncbi:lamin tail domain-containing protein [Candidatus Woesearchaeota archaeon]|nr:lamin tail domain-containing protein [Candidatus Woesearchaeota archaeon]
MKKIGVKICVLVLVFILSSVFSIFVAANEGIIINQVYVDPVDTEAGGEAIELFNPTQQTIDISGYTIKTESSNADVTIPINSKISSNSYYLITDLGWSSLKDNSLWPKADHEEAMTLYNTNSGIALVNKNLEIIDAVGWGDIAEIIAGLYENTAAPNPPTGFSLKRINFQDTNNNSNDFMSFMGINLIFYNSSFVYNASDDNKNNNSNNTKESQNNTETNTTYDISIELPVIINLTNSAPTIIDYNLSLDESEEEGYQIMPNAGEIKDVEINVVVDDNDGNEDVNYVTALVTAPEFVKEIQLNKTANVSNGALFSGNIIMNYYDTPEKYNIVLTAKDSSNENSEKSIEFEYLSVVSFDIDAEQLVFDNVKNKEVKEINGDANFSTKTTPTLKNLGNTKLEVGVYSNSLALDGNVMQYKFSGDYNNITTKIVANETLEQLNFGAEKTLPLSFKIALEKYLKPDVYLANINIVGVAS